MIVEEGFSSVTSDGFTVETNTETAEAIAENFASEPKPLDGEPPDPEKEAAQRVSKAASVLGEKGGKAAAEAREAKDAEGDGEEVPEEKPKPKDHRGNPRHDPKARMLEATRKEAEAKRQLASERAERQRLADEASKLRAELEALKAPKVNPQPKQAATNGNGQAGKPKVADYENYEDFTEALADWTVAQRLDKQRRETEAHSEAKSYADRVKGYIETFNERMAKAREQTPDFEERTETVSQFRPSFMLGSDEAQGPENVLADEIIRSEHGPALMLYLEEHPEELKKVLSLGSPTEIQVEVRLMARGLGAATTGKPAPKTQAVSQAKPPITPVIGSPNAADSDDEASDDEPFEIHFRREQARENRARRALLAQR